MKSLILAMLLVVLAVPVMAEWDGDVYYPNPSTICVRLGDGSVWCKDIYREPVSRYKWDGTPLTDRELQKRGVPLSPYKWDGTPR